MQEFNLQGKIMQVEPSALSSRLDAIVGAPAVQKTPDVQVKAVAKDSLGFTPRSIDKIRANGDEEGFVEMLAHQTEQIANELGMSFSFRVKVSDSGQYYVEVRDRSDGSKIKTIPSEDLLDMKERLHEVVTGMLVDEKS